MAVKLLNAATATGASNPLDLQPPKLAHTVQATMGGDVVATAVTVDLEGSVDGASWFTLASHAFTAAEITAEKSMFHVVNKVVSCVRVNITALTGGTNPTVSVWYDNRD